MKTNQSSFRAYVVKLNSTDKKIVMELKVDADIEAEDLLAAMKMVGSNVFVTLGDPQLSMDFEDEETPDDLAADPIKYQTDASGVVVKVFPLPEPDKKEQPDKEGENIVEGEFTVITDDQEDENTDSSGQEETEKPDKAEQGPTEEEIEEYILSGKAPLFEDIQFDFPDLLHKKKSMGSWTKVAANIGVSVGKLTRSFKEYKSRVAEQMPTA